MVLEIQQSSFARLTGFLRRKIHKAFKRGQRTKKQYNNLELTPHLPKEYLLTIEIKALTVRQKREGSP